MKQNQLPRVDAFCSKYDYRPVMNCVFIDGNYAVGSDEHILIKVDVSANFDKIELMNHKMIHRAVWFNMLYATQRVASETGITSYFQNYSCEFKYTDPGVKYPDYMSLLKPAYKDSIGDESVSRLTLTPRLVGLLTKITDMPVSFRFISDSANIFICNNDFHGILMPCMEIESFDYLKEIL